MISRVSWQALWVITSPMYVWVYVDYLCPGLPLARVAGRKLGPALPFMLATHIIETVSPSGSIDLSQADMSAANKQFGEDLGDLRRAGRLYRMVLPYRHGYIRWPCGVVLPRTCCGESLERARNKLVFGDGCALFEGRTSGLVESSKVVMPTIPHLPKMVQSSFLRPFDFPRR